jgi:hypothetical protein
MGQLREELVQFLLSLIELSTAYVVYSEKRHDTVNDEKTVFVAHKEFGDLIE